VTTYLTSTAPDRESTGLQAVLLDMDGTLVDTEDFWWEAEYTLLAELGYRLGHTDREVVVGGPMSRVMAHLVAVSGVDLTVEELGAMVDARFLALIARGVPLRPGAEALLAELAAEGIPTVLVSAAQRQIVDVVLRTLGEDRFVFSVAGDEVEQTKPHPDPYLLAAARLGADPACCVVVEDSLTGVRSGEAAGCPVLAVPSVAAIDPAPGRTVRASLEGVGVALLRSLVADADGVSK
jgi:HAD superfamily hydrolase (TIGR01509 family)